MMVICEDAVNAGLVALATDMETGFVEGIALGATKSTCDAAPPEKFWQGLEPTVQIWPNARFPPGMPPTLQFKFPADAAPPAAVRVMRWFVASVAVTGESVTPLPG
jgi:hypothetical protein